METGLHEDHLKYRQALNAATKQVKRAKRKMEKKLENNIKTDPKA